MLPCQSRPPVLFLTPCFANHIPITLTPSHLAKRTPKPRSNPSPPKLVPSNPCLQAIPTGSAPLFSLPGTHADWEAKKDKWRGTTAMAGGFSTTTAGAVKPLVIWEWVLDIPVMENG